jgi:hypothetical protein
MSSIKCPHCGLVNFSSEGTCKRCKNVLSASAPAESSSAHTPAAVAPKSSRFRSDNPPVAWAITIVLLVANASLAYAVSLKSTTDVYETVGSTVGGVLAWPIVLLIIYGLSKKFRETYSLHAVINYGLGLNTIIQSIMILG